MLNAVVGFAAGATEETTDALQHAYALCRDEARARGIDLYDFGTDVTVQDIERVRVALGIERWNVSGTSYGTTVAMTLAARHPETVRTLVLDSLYPPDPVPPWSVNVAKARHLFFAACAADAACNAAHPDLQRRYDESLASLADASFIIPMPDRLHLPGNQLGISASLFELMVANLIYYRPAYPALRTFITLVHDRHEGGTGPIVANLLDGFSSLDLALHASVECRDRSRFHAPPPPNAANLDRGELFEVCRSWSDPGPPPLIPIGSNIPTLILDGAFDPVSRPDLTRHIGSEIGRRSQWVLFEGIGHSVRTNSACAVRIVSHFISEPDTMTDTACAAVAPTP